MSSGFIFYNYVREGCHQLEAQDCQLKSGSLPLLSDALIVRERHWLLQGNATYTRDNCNLGAVIMHSEILLATRRSPPDGCQTLQKNTWLK